MRLPATETSRWVLSPDRGAQRRQSTRVALCLDVDAWTTGLPIRFRATDANITGLFILCENPFPLHARVRLVVHLSEDEAVPMQGDVVWVQRLGMLRRGELPGFGLRYIDLAPAVARRWREFYAAMERSKDRRRYRRFPVMMRVAVRVRSSGQLMSVYSKNLSRRGALFHTEAPVAPDTELSLVFLSDDSQARFGLTGRVVRCLAAPGGYHIGVEFSDLARAQFCAVISKLPSEGC